MPRSYIDLTGQRIGKLTVKKIAHRGNGVFWKCLCDCGNWTVVRGSHLSNAHTQSCGCWNKQRSAIMGQSNRRHGHTPGGRPSPTHASWQQMRRRCVKPHATGYRNYGGRGIKVCDRWQTFENFLADMGEQPPGKEIDRIDNDGDYEPGNCRWATIKEQARNRRTNHFVTIKGETHTIVEWAEISGISPQRIRQRLVLQHWHPDKLLSPVRIGNYR